MDDKIRAVKRKDMPRVIELLQSISSFAPTANELDEIWTRFATQDHVSALVVVDGRDEVLAYGSIVYETKIRGGLMGHLEDIAVAAKCRGRGLGMKLIEALINQGRNRGAYKIGLACQPHNRGFYDRLGFAENGMAMARFAAIPTASSARGAGNS